MLPMLNKQRALQRVLFLVFWLVCGSLYSQDTIQISPALSLIKITENTYIHLSYHDTETWGSVPCNGLVFVNDNKAFLFDTPMTDSLTPLLYSWLQDSMHIQVIGFVPNHWHADCTEGLDFINKHNIASYAGKRTNDILSDKQLPTAARTFEDSTTLWLGDKPIVCDFLGAGHTADNIVVWLPSEGVLFPGCMCKSLEAEDLGYTDDADLDQWPRTIQAVLDKYPNASIVVPGHGDYGDKRLLEHTIELLRQKD